MHVDFTVLAIRERPITRITTPLLRLLRGSLGAAFSLSPPRWGVVTPRSLLTAARRRASSAASASPS
jgi:hypothetical protein